jgi:twitching motility protein PilT
MTKQLNQDPELQELIRKLNAAAQIEPAEEPDTDSEAGREQPSARTGLAPGTVRWRLPAADDEDEDWLRHLLGEAHRSGASDLLLVVDSPPVMRVDGSLRTLGERRLTGAALGRLSACLVPTARRANLQREGALDFTVTRGGGLGRFRCNVHRERDHWAAAIRLLPTVAPELEELGLPVELARFTELEHGLLLVTGPTGSGKSTTLAALARRILERRQVHLITIEDPVEYEQTHRGSVVEHIEIGRDTTSFASALRAALRQDPDVLLIGEMRDLESISIAITAAETGHLVISTLHTGDAPQTINRILDSYPANQVEAVRTQLSISLAGVVSQQLLPRRDGKGRVPAAEVLMATHAVRNLIRQGKIEMIRSQQVLERSSGMLTLDQSLAALAHSGTVDLADARSRARVPAEFDSLLKRNTPTP